MDEQEVPETIYLTGAQIRKLARLIRLHPPNTTVKIEAASADFEEEAVQVEFLDEYGYRVPGVNGAAPGRTFVIRQNGWSNPSVGSAAARIALWNAR